MKMRERGICIKINSYFCWIKTRCSILLAKDIFMDWLQVFTIVGILGGFMFFMLQRIEKDIDSIGKRLDRDIDSLGRRLDGHAQRIDQLYRMFVDLIKEKNNK